LLSSNLYLRKFSPDPTQVLGIRWIFQWFVRKLDSGFEWGVLPMSAPGSVTHWLGRLQAGDVAGAQRLWERYFQRLVGLARKKLQGQKLCLGDEQDIALSAFHSFCRAAEQGRFPQLSDRKDLWQILVMLTARKAWALVKHENRKKRCVDANMTADLEQVIGRDASPEFAAQMAEDFQVLLDKLEDDDLRQLALLKLEGWTNAEIAAKLECVLRTVERKLSLIRQIWSEEMPS
jgi:DNA-directed RNA polymerase specialized sigma24 family protein